MTSRRGGRPPIRALRTLLLVALVGFVAIVAALFWFGRQGKREGADPTVEASRDAEAGSGNLIFDGRGFRREITDGGEKIFAISADRILSEQEDQFTLENVSIELEREEGRAYRLASARGVFDVATSEATLDGAVRVEGPDNLTLSTEELRLGGKGNVVQSEFPVTFTVGDGIRGRGAKLHFNLRRDRFLLTGNVWISSSAEALAPDDDERAEGAENGDARSEDEEERGPSDGFVLRCQRLLFERSDRMVHADELVRVHRGGDRVFAKRLSLQLAENERDIELINARWNVVGFLDGSSDTVSPTEGATDGAVSAPVEPAAPGPSYRFGGQRLALSFVAGSDQPRRVELLSDGGPDVILTRIAPTGGEQRITSENVYGDFEQGELRVAEAVGGVDLVETTGGRRGRELRTARSDRAVLTYPQSEPKGRLALEGGVDYRSADLRLTGSRADIALSERGEGVIEGNPAVVIAESGRVEAPRILQENGRLHAVGGVRAELEKGGVQIGGGTDSDEPILVQSREAYWNDATREYEFLGNVRAWQGENYLLSEEMKGFVDTETVTAGGGVRTVWKIESEPSAGDGAGPEDPPVEVTAESMHYDAPSRKIVYDGEAHAKQQGRHLWCDRIDGFLLEGGGFDTLNCSGATRIQDPADGTTVVGTGAIYEPEADRVTVSGNPVVLTKSDGTEIRGDRLLYDLESGTAQVQLLEPPVDEASADRDPDLEPADFELESEHVDPTAGS